MCERCAKRGHSRSGSARGQQSAALWNPKHFGPSRCHVRIVTEGAPDSCIGHLEVSPPGTNDPATGVTVYPGDEPPTVTITEPSSSYKWKVGDKINLYAQDRIARFVAKRHKRNWGYGLRVVLYKSPDRLGLINLEGTIVAPRPNRPWRPGR